MTGLFLIIVILIGLSLPVQTAINAALQKSIGTPLATSFLTITIGTFITVAIALASIGSTHWSVAPDLPWYAWTGGICGAIGVSLYIVLFPKIGSVQTILLPILGQIVTGLLIDLFGWFGMAVTPLTASHALGFLIVVAGVCMVVLKKAEGTKGSFLAKLPWQALGIFAGAMMAAQSAMNGTLGARIHSPASAAAVSSVLSSVFLLVIVLGRKKDRDSIKRAFTVHTPAWQWIGGFIGVFIVLGYAASAPVLGVGLMTIVSILGQLSSSVAIDRYGLLGAAKTGISPVQYLGLGVVLTGSMIIYLV